MSFLNKKKYVIGDEFILNNEEDFMEYLKYHLIRKKDVVNIQSIHSVLELQFNVKGKLVKINELIEDEKNQIIHKENFLNLDEIKNFPENDVKIINQSKTKTNCYLGGNGESKFTLPYDEKIGTPFINIGKLTKTLGQFDILPFEELFITYPLHSSIDGFLYLDYQNNYSPKVIGEVKIIEHPFGLIDKTGELEYEKVYLKYDPVNKITKEDFEFGDHIFLGKIGSPFWLQHPNIPKSPKTGKSMKFLLQLETFNKIKCIKNNIKLKNPAFNESFNYLNFWGSGYLYVFIEPETKTLALLIQST